MVSRTAITVAYMLNPHAGRYGGPKNPALILVSTPPEAHSAQWTYIIICTEAFNKPSTPVE